MGARPDFTMPIAALGVALAVVMPRLLKEGPMDTYDWVYVGLGLGVVAIVGIILTRALLTK